MAGHRCRTLLGAGAALVFLLPAKADASELASDWSENFNSRTRLSAARLGDGAAERLFAFVEVELPAGWKTYWKVPGDSGVPPEFDFGKSRNLAGVEVLYPAPRRMIDKGGEVIGYKERVTFPVEVRVADPSRPVALDLALQFGICKDICIPTEVTMALEIEPGADPAASDLQRAALSEVPRSGPGLEPGDPVLKRTAAVLTGEKPRLTIEASYPSGASGADLFIEAPGGAYLPPPKKLSENGGDIVFEVDLSADVDLEALKGAELTATLVADAGHSLATFKLE